MATFVPLATESPDDPEGQAPSKAPHQTHVAKALGWLTGTWTAACIVVAVVRGDWWQVLRCLPGCMFGMLLACMVSQAKVEPQQLPGWLRSAWPMFLCLLTLPLMEMPWQRLILEVAASLLSAAGIQAHESGRIDCGSWLQLCGLVSAWLGIFQFLLPTTWQSPLSLLPSILGLGLTCMSNPVWHPYSIVDFGGTVWGLVLPPYLLALPLSSLWPVLTVLEVSVYGVFCTLWCFVLHHGIGPKIEMISSWCNFLCHFSFYLFFATLPVGIFAVESNRSCAVAGPWCQYWPWTGLVLPFAMATSYLALEAGLLLWARGCQFMSRKQFLTRVLVTSVLLIAPFLLHVDVEEWQSEMEIPDLSPFTYVNINPQNLSQPLLVKSNQFHWLQMPQPLWPTKAETKASGTRSYFWLTFMFFKFVVATIFVVLVLRCNCRSRSPQSSSASSGCEEGKEEVGTLMVSETFEREETQAEGAQKSFLDEYGTIILPVVLGTHLVLCSTLSMSAAYRGQLTQSTGLNFEGGLDFEGYDVMLSAGLLWFVAQALAVRSTDLTAQYSVGDVVLSTVFLVPFLGDGFDSLKDAMIASIAMGSGHAWLISFGVAALLYLFCFHAVLLSNPSNWLELQRSYMPCFFLKPQKEAETKHETKRLKVLKLLFQQTTPSRQRALMIEDAPQAVLACLVSWADSLKPFTLVMNIAFPLVRLVSSWSFHDQIAWQVRGWILEEAEEARGAGRLQLCDEFVAALHRLQVAYPQEELWRSLQIINENACHRAKDGFISRWKQGQEDYISLDVFMFLQLLGEDLSDQLTQAELQFHVLHSQIFDPGARVLGDGLSKFVHLTTLDLNLGFNSIGIEGAKGLGEGLSKLGNLTILKLNLQLNRIGDAGAKGLGEGLSKLGNLTTLDLNLRGNRMWSKGAKGLGEGLSKLGNLTTLDLNLKDNSIGNEGAKGLCDGLSKLVNLTTLELNLLGNSIGILATNLLGIEVASEIKKRLQRTIRNVTVECD